MNPSTATRSGVVIGTALSVLLAGIAAATALALYDHALAASVAGEIAFATAVVVILAAVILRTGRELAHDRA